MGVVVRRYIDILILLILYLFFFAAASLLFVHFLKCFLYYSRGDNGSIYTCTHTLAAIKEVIIIIIIM